MQVAQRSASAVAVSDGSNEGYQTIDRMHFSYGNSAAGAANISQATDAPTTLGFTKSHKTDVTTVNSTSSGNGVIGIKYGIEGQDLRSSGWNHLSASSYLTLSFYFKTTKTGTSKLPIMFRIYHGTAYYYVQNVTVTDPTNWNRYTVRLPGNSNLTINDLNTQAMAIFFSYQTGSDKDTNSEGAWGTTNAYSTSESTNYFDSTSNDMFITGIQLEVDHTGSGKPTDFEHRSYAQELALCQRYYETSYPYGVAIGGNNSYTGMITQSGSTNGSATMIVSVSWNEKRTTPTVTPYNPVNGNSGSWYAHRSGSTTHASVTIDMISTRRCRLYFNVGANWEASNAEGHVVVDAEI